MTSVMLMRSIKQCTEIDMGWLLTTHHEMGHIEYFLQYKNQPVQFRDGANPGKSQSTSACACSLETAEHMHVAMDTARLV